jgi:hypothetical protein
MRLVKLHGQPLPVSPAKAGKSPGHGKKLPETKRGDRAQYIQPPAPLHPAGTDPPLMVGRNLVPDGELSRSRRQ